MGDAEDDAMDMIEVLLDAGLDEIEAMGAVEFCLNHEEAMELHYQRQPGIYWRQREMEKE